jgi:CheY-like chemotaxis protein
MDKAGEILLVEDDPRDVELTLTALRESRIANGVVVVRDGAQALEYLYRRGAYEQREEGNPAVILLDLKLPKVDGLEVLRQIKAEERLKNIPVVMLTSSREEQDLVGSYASGANAYVVKPVEFEDFLEAVRRLGLFWTVVNHPPPGSRGAAG